MRIDFSSIGATKARKRITKQLGSILLDMDNKLQVNEFFNSITNGMLVVMLMMFIKERIVNTATLVKKLPTIHYTTVYAYLDILIRLGYVTKTKKGRINVYEANNIFNFLMEKFLE